jgi:hypothetical protein
LVAGITMTQGLCVGTVTGNHYHGQLFQRTRGNLLIIGTTSPFLTVVSLMRAVEFGTLLLCHAAYMLRHRHPKQRKRPSFLRRNRLHKLCIRPL